MICSEMIEQKAKFENIEQAEHYVEDVRSHYREEDASYRGRRTPDQELIAEVTSDEARIIADGVLLGMLSISGNGGELSEDDTQEFKVGGHTWEEFRTEYERILVGFGVITNRLERDGYDVDSYSDMSLSDRLKVASVLFSSYLGHNALRFGVESAGIKHSIGIDVNLRTDGVAKQWVRVDKDKARDPRMIKRNMRKRGFTSGPRNISPAAKMSEADYITLRRAFPDVPKDDFDTIVSFSTDARKELEKRE